MTSLVVSRTVPGDINATQPIKKPADLHLGLTGYVYFKNIVHKILLGLTGPN